VAKWSAFLVTAARGVYFASYRGSFVRPEAAIESDGGTLAAKRSPRDGARQAPQDYPKGVRHGALSRPLQNLAILRADQCDWVAAAGLLGHAAWVAIAKLDRASGYAARRSPVEDEILRRIAVELAEIGGRSRRLLYLSTRGAISFPTYKHPSIVPLSC
jgi:hypothetical protein